jgi:ketosteroid isomerase-like protein
MSAQHQHDTAHLPDWVRRPIADMPTLADQGQLKGAAADVQAVLTRYSEATVRRDLAAVEQCFVTTDDFLIVESSYPNFGWDDYKRNHLVPELETIEDLQYRADLIQCHVTDQLAYGVFKFAASGVNQGNRRTVEGLGTVVLVPSDDGWKIRHWATCSRRPPTHTHG